MKGSAASANARERGERSKSEHRKTSERANEVKRDRAGGICPGICPEGVDLSKRELPKSGIERADVA